MISLSILCFSLILFITTVNSIPAVIRDDEGKPRVTGTGTLNAAGLVCFPPNARIRLADGKLVRMDQLVLGKDGSDATGWGTYSPLANIGYAGDDDDGDDDDSDDNNGPVVV